MLYAQMLFDPFKEQFYLPAAFIQQGNGEGRQKKAISEKDQNAYFSRYRK